MTRPAATYLATDVGLWMAMPAVLPAVVIGGVVLYIAARDRREPDAEDTD